MTSSRPGSSANSSTASVISGSGLSQAKAKSRASRMTRQSLPTPSLTAVTRPSPCCRADSSTAEKRLRIRLTSCRLPPPTAAERVPGCDMWPARRLFGGRPIIRLDDELPTPASGARKIISSLSRSPLAPCHAKPSSSCAATPAALLTAPDISAVAKLLYGQLQSHPDFARGTC